MWFISCLYALLLVGITCGAAATPFFRKDYEFNADTQNFYKIHTITRPWREAKARCQLEGASLFVPDSKQDYDAVVALMQTRLQAWDYAWMGIYDILSEGEFITVDGVSIDDVYHQWDDWEPNNDKYSEDCVTIKKNAKNNDEDCENKFPFICKKSRSSLQWNVLCDLPDQGYLYNRDLKNCYKLHLEPRNWTDAYSICAAEQSYLTVINGKAESDHLVKMVADAPKDKIKENVLKGAVHVGFHNRLDEGFTTIQGVKIEDSGYAVWGGGQPDNTGGHEKCGSIFYDGTLNDISCGAVCIFICEHEIGQLSFTLDERIKTNEA